VAVVKAPPPLFGVSIYSDGENITEIRFEKKRVPSPTQPKVLKEAAVQMKAFLGGTRKNFELPLEVKGTDFQTSVWKALRRIPYGQSKTYTEVATKVGKPKACRAVGNAVGKNPFPIIIPCHRVKARGGLGGFSGGLPIKRWLLEKESRGV